MNYPAWYKPEEDAPPVMFRTALEVPKGWIHVPGSYNVQTGQWEDESPLDHDHDGKKGGSEAQGGEDIADLRAAYKARFGKRPFNGWSAAELAEKLA